MKNSFTTQWGNQNIKITYPKETLLDYFMGVFFKKWIKSPLKESGNQIIIKLGKKKKEKIKAQIFDYSREIKGDCIITNVYNVRIFRAVIRSLYKSVFLKSSVVGVPELYMAIIRKGIVEPIEYYNHMSGWGLIHANVFEYDGKTFVITAGSKVGKSTLINKLSEQFKIRILSDNYCFINKNKVRTFEEPLRGGKESRAKLSFYNRSINGYPHKFEGEIDYFIYLKRSNENYLIEINNKELEKNVREINKSAGEGIFFLNSKDPLKIDPKDFILKNGDFKSLELGMKQGLHNIYTTMNLIINLAEK